MAAAALALTGVACQPLPAPSTPATPTGRPWGEVDSWAYWLDSPDTAALSRASYELLVLDDLGAASLRTIKNGPCMPRLVAYLSIGEAEDYRWYWQDGWRPDTPSWLLGENPDWEGNYSVKFWDPEWWRIMGLSIDRLVDLGYEGVYLDRVDAYTDRVVAGHRSYMVGLVHALALRARLRSPLGDDFGVFIQNAEELASAPDVVDVINGIGREETYVAATDERVPLTERRETEALLDVVKQRSRSGLVLTVDYADSAALATDAERSARAKGYVPYVTDVDLDRLSTRPSAGCDG